VAKKMKEKPVLKTSDLKPVTDFMFFVANEMNETFY